MFWNEAALTCLGLVWHEIKLFQVDCAAGEENTAEEVSKDIDKYQTGDKRSQQEMGTVLVFKSSFCIKTACNVLRKCIS